MLNPIGITAYNSQPRLYFDLSESYVNCWQISLNGYHRNTTFCRLCMPQDCECAQRAAVDDCISCLACRNKTSPGELLEKWTN